MHHLAEKSTICGEAPVISIEKEKPGTRRKRGRGSTLRPRTPVRRSKKNDRIRLYHTKTYVKRRTSGDAGSAAEPGEEEERKTTPTTFWSLEKEESAAEGFKEGMLPRTIPFAFFFLLRSRAAGGRRRRGVPRRRRRLALPPRRPTADCPRRASRRGARWGSRPPLRSASSPA